jgi:hypothetical protein
MTVGELYALVTIHSNQYGSPHFIVLADVPEPWHTQFKKALRGSACPIVIGFGDCAFARDWTDWVNGVTVRIIQLALMLWNFLRKKYDYYDRANNINTKRNAVAE